MIRVWILAAMLMLGLTGCSSPTEEEVEAFPPFHLPLLVAQQGVGEGEVVLRWTRAGTNVTHWQYRLRASPDWDLGLEYFQADELPYWTPWEDVPGSDADTTGYRVSDLDDDVYFFQVRPWTADGPGRAYWQAYGTPSTPGPDGIPNLARDSVHWIGTPPENGGTFRIADTDLVLDVPAGLLLLVVRSPDTVSVHDMLSAAYARFDRNTGELVERSNVAYPFSYIEVEELFDRLISSVRRVPIDAAAAP